MLELPGEDERGDEDRRDARRRAHREGAAEQDVRAAVARADEQARRDETLRHRQQVREREADDDEHEPGDLLEDAPVDDAAERARERAEDDEDER